MREKRKPRLFEVGFEARRPPEPCQVPAEYIPVSLGMHLLSCNTESMRDVDSTKRRSPPLLTLTIDKDEDSFYVIESPDVAGCYTQGKTLDEALENIREVVVLLREEGIRL